MLRKFSRFCYIAAGIIIMLFLLTLNGCAQPAYAAAADDSESLQAQFVTVANHANYAVVYNRANRVMYVVSDGNKNRGSFTLLVNEDGSPMIWKG